MNVPQAGNATTAMGGTGPTNTVFGPPVAYMRPGNNQAFDKNMAYMENRGRLRFDAIMGKEMSGTFYFEVDSNRWGERAGTGAQRNQAGHWGVADRAAVEVKNMFLTFGMPWIPVPTTIMAGIQPFYVRPGVFLATDGPGISASFKVDPATIKLMWAKAGENKDWASDDSDLYGIEANAKIQTMTVGGYFVLFNMGTYPLSDAEPTPAAGASSKVWWAGLYMDGKLGPVNANFDFIYDKGKNEDRRDITTRAGDIDFSGWGLMLNVGYPWEKFLFGFSSIYGSGADANKTSTTALPGDAVASGSGAISSKVGAYIVPAGTEGSVGHSLVLCGNGINRNNTGYEQAASSAHAAAGFGGLWINKVYAAFQVSPVFNTRIEAMYIRDNTKNGNTFGDALETDGAVKSATNQLRDDNDIGWEIDWLNKLQLYKNLSFQFGIGYLFAGDAMDLRNTTTNTNESPKNPYVVTTNLTYSF
jgi:hypothetical protein